MSKINKKVLYLVDLVVAGFIQNKGNFKLATLNIFPHGACDWSSYIAMRVLRSYDIDGLTLVNGVNKWGRGHTWIDAGDFYIDVSVKQFGQRKKYCNAIFDRNGKRLGYDIKIRHCENNLMFRSSLVLDHDFELIYKFVFASYVQGKAII